MNYSEQDAQQITMIFNNAWEWLAQAYCGSQFIGYLDRADLLDVRDGVFVIEVPTPMIAALFNRRSEKRVIVQALEVFTPHNWNWHIDIEFVVGQGRPVAAGPDYLEMEEIPS